MSNDNSTVTVTFLSRKEKGTFNRERKVMGCSTSRLSRPYSAAALRGAVFSKEESVNSNSSNSSSNNSSSPRLEKGRLCGHRKLTGSFNWRVGVEEDHTEKQTFACTIWRPDVKPKALLCLNHGYGEYLSEEWDVVGRFFAGRGFLTFGHDHLGHGRSSGERVQSLVSFEEDYCVPVAAHCQARKEEEDREVGADLPLFMLGHSMGCLITLMAAQHSPSGLFHGVILMAPPFDVDAADYMTPEYEVLGRCISFFWPSMEVLEFDPDDATSDESWTRKLREDKLNWHGGIKMRQTYLAMKAGDEIDRECPRFRLPILIQQGDADTICRPEGSEYLLRHVSSDDKTLKMYEGAKHNLFVESGDIPARVLEDGLRWMEERLDSDSKEEEEKLCSLSDLLNCAKPLKYATPEFEYEQLDSLERLLHQVVRGQGRVEGKQ